MDYLGDFTLQTGAGQDIFNQIISYQKKQLHWNQSVLEKRETHNILNRQVLKQNALFYISFTLL